MDTIGSRLRYLRKKKGLRQEDVADIIKVDRSNFPHYESNKRPIDDANITILADFFGVPEQWIKKGTDESDAPVQVRQLPESNQDSIIEELKATYEKVIEVKDGFIMNLQEQIAELRRDKEFFRTSLGK
ncbi:MAG: helix-turn-helix transcriptional regulator [Bacteroidota bacterium]